MQPGESIQEFSFFAEITEDEGPKTKLPQEAQEELRQVDNSEDKVLLKQLFQLRGEQCSSSEESSLEVKLEDLLAVKSLEMDSPLSPLGTHENSVSLRLEDVQLEDLMNANSSLSVSLKNASPSELLENERCSPEARARSRPNNKAPSPEQKKKNWLLLTGESMPPSSFTHEFSQSSHRDKHSKNEKNDLEDKAVPVKDNKLRDRLTPPHGKLEENPACAPPAHAPRRIVQQALPQPKKASGSEQENTHPNEGRRRLPGD